MNIAGQHQFKKFKRLSDGHEVFGGVCSGLAYALGVPTWILRAAAFVSIACYGAGLFPYLLVAFLAPSWDEAPADYEERCE